MKRTILLILAIVFIFSGIAVLAQESFVTVKLPYPEGEELFKTDYQAYDNILMRYKDDKTPIPLSVYYDGFVYATIPYEHKDRETEVFIAEELSFSDDNGDFEYYIMEKLSATGVVKGDEFGRANPYDNVTRAEATAMVMRAVGLDKSQKLNIEAKFDDVKEDDWFYNVVMNAYQYNIVKGDSENIFSPNRNVSREEMVTMIARGIWAATIFNENKDVTYDYIKESLNVEDEKDISSWALSAYDRIAYAAPRNYVTSETQVDIEGIPVTLNYLLPQQAALRHEVASTLNRIIEQQQIYPSDLAEQFGFDKNMPVIDGSTSTYPFTDAIYRNLFYSGYNHPQRPAKHSKSFESYKKLISGEIDAMIASVYPSSEIFGLAKENGVELELIPIAHDAMIFFTNIENPANGLTKEQISNIYVNNAYQNWNEIGGTDALLYPYCRNNDSGSHAQMEKHFLNGNEIHPEVQKETSFTMSNVLTDVMAAKTDNPVGYGLGYSIYYYYHNMDMFYDVHNNLKLLAIDGVMPTDETIANKSYPLSNNTYVVIRKDSPEDSPARKLAEFMLTEVGQICVEEAGFGKLIK